MPYPLAMGTPNTQFFCSDAPRLRTRGARKSSKVYRAGDDPLPARLFLLSEAIVKDLIDRGQITRETPFI